MEPEGSLLRLQVPITCPYPEPDQFSPRPHPTSWRFILILSFHLCLCLPCLFFPSGCPTKILYSHLPSPIHVMWPTHLTSWFDHQNNVWRVQIIKLLVLQSSQFCCHHMVLQPKYPPQHPILEHPQPMFQQCDRPSFTAIQNNRQNYISVDLYLYIFD